MKFGVLQFFSWPGRRGDLSTVYQRALDRIRTMDSNGYDAVWLAEHHFSTYSVCPSVHVMAMHAADITKNLRIGTAVSLAPFYHPLRLAEDVALLDHLTGGRINWGVGRGFDRREFQAFEIPSDESRDRLQECVQIVLKCWTENRVTFRGKFHQLKDVEVLPKPLQDPLPFWIASTSPQAIEWSASQGYGILMDPHGSHDQIQQKYQKYRTLLEENGHENSQDTPMARLIAIGDSANQAEQIARSGAEWMFGSYFNTDTKGMPADDQEKQTRFEDYVANTIIHGTTDMVAEELMELKETIPLNYLMAAPLSHKSFELLTYEVLPHLA